MSADHRTGVVYGILRKLELPVLLATPAMLVACAMWQVNQTAILTLLVAVCSVTTLFASFEASRPTLRQIMPSVVLGAVAAAGRVLFAPIPEVQPLGAITIMAGSIFGSQQGFMVGALAALVSNIFFGQGPWTAWQMYSWGVVGYLAGIFGTRGWLERKPVLCSFGFFAGIVYGLIMDTWTVIGFVHPLTWAGALLVYLTSVPFNITRGVSNVVFLLLIYAPWSRKLLRVKRKYGLYGI